MRLALSFLAGLLLGACQAFTPAAPAQSHVSTPSLLTDMTVTLAIDGSVCSGVWVSPRHILTASHCLESLEHGDVAEYATKSDLEGSVRRIAILNSIDAENDLGLLFALVPPAHGIATLGGDVEQGACVQGMGSPLGLWFTYTQGVVSSIRHMDLGNGERLWIQSTAPVSPGSSGGGLFDTEGRLVGIVNSVYGTASHGQALNMFVHTRYILAYLRKAKIL